MKIAQVETLACDGGWRNYNFLKIVTDDGIAGWSEYDEAYGPPGLTTVIQRYAERLIGRSVSAHERIFSELYAMTRPAPLGQSAEALGAIENALLDAKAKKLEVPCYELLGGMQRDRIPVYWSHCASWRINHPQFYEPAITDLEGVKKSGADARERGFAALKTNIFIEGGDGLRAWMPGFGVPFSPALNVDPKVLRHICAHLEALRDGAGPDVEILIDLNFNAKTEGYLRILRALADFELFWVELDTYSPEALAYIRSQSPHPISSCETLFGVRQFLPYFHAQAMDVAIVDAIWNGVWQAMKIANVAEAYEVNVAPHNFYGHLATMINTHFAAAIPNLRIMEMDVDRLPWDDELFTIAPEYDRGQLVVPQTPGWGTEPNEAALKARPPKVFKDYLGFKKS